MNQACVLASGSMQYNKDGTEVRKRAFCCRIRIKEREGTWPLACGFPKRFNSPGQGESVPRLVQGETYHQVQSNRAGALGETETL